MISERKLAFKYLCKKKSRSVATLIAIVLSVFIVFVSGNMVMSAYYAEYAEGLKRDGNHVAYLDGVKTEDIEKLEQEGAVVCALENSKSYIGEIEEGEQSEVCKFHSFEDFSKFPYSFEITEGSVPSQTGEVLLHEDVRYVLGENGDIGDRITVDVTEWEWGTIIMTEEGEAKEVTKTYTLAGYYDCPEDSWLEIERKVALVKDEPRKQGNAYRVYITSEEEGIIDLEEVKNLEELEDWAKNLGTLFGAEVEVNSSFRKSNSDSADFIYCLILLAGAAIGGFAVVVIRNAFVMSVVERTRDYGMLRCIGSSERQIRKIAFYEGVILGVTGLGIGLFLSYLCLYFGVAIGKRYFSLSECFRVVHRPVLILGTCVIVLAVVLFSLLEPTRQINRLSPLNALRNRKDIKKERFRAGGKMSRFIGKIFGVEGEYAYKNLMRNRKKFITMTASGVLSIAFFVGINGALVYTQDNSGYYNAEVYFDENYSYSDATTNTESAETTLNRVEKELRKIKGVGNVTIYDGGFYLIDHESLKWKSDGTSATSMAIYTIDEAKNPLSNKSVIEGNIGNLEGLECYVVNWEYEVDTGEWTEQFDVSPGDKIDLHSFVAWGKEAKEENISQIEVKAVLKEHPIKDYLGTFGNVIFMSEEGFRKLESEQGIDLKGKGIETAGIFLNIDQDCDISKVKEVVEKNGMILIDEMEEERESASYVKTIKFIVNIILILVTLISAMNVFNNMESNFILREKERNIMRAIGMSAKQYRKMILLEGILSSVISILLGTVIGLGFGYGIYRLVLFSVEGMKYAVAVGSIIGAGAGIMLLTLCTCYGGMKKEEELSLS
ncbi:MAG: ABC transporter permease [Lachnospiraceae bacterium]|nr:ABC transporter permease [Lachnospiraceae bacterium]